MNRGGLSLHGDPPIKRVDLGSYKEVITCESCSYGGYEIFPPTKTAQADVNTSFSPTREWLDHKNPSAPVSTKPLISACNSFELK